MVERIHPSQSLILAGLLNDYGVVCKYTGQFVRADRMYRRSLKLALDLAQSAERKELVATLYHNLGGIAHARRRYAEGLRHARRGIAIRKRIRPRDAVAVTADEAALAAILVDLGRTPEAESIYLRALHLFHRKLGSRHYEVGAVLASLGAIYSRKGNLREAERSLRRAALIIEGFLGRNHPRAASALNNLAVVCARRGKVTEAGALYRRLLRALEGQGRSTYPKTAMIRANYGKLQKMVAAREQERLVLELSRRS